MAGGPAATRAMGRVPQSLLPLLCETFSSLVATVGCERILVNPAIKAFSRFGLLSLPYIQCTEIMSSSSMSCFSVALIAVVGAETVGRIIGFG